MALFPSLSSSPQKPQSQSSAGSTSAPTKISISDQEPVHVMPRKFLKPQTAKEHKKPAWLIVVAAVLVVAIGAVVAVLVLMSSSPTNPPVNNNANGNFSNTNTLDNSNTVGVEAVQVEVKNRDGQVVGDALLQLPPGSIPTGTVVEILGYAPSRRGLATGLNETAVLGGFYTLLPAGLELLKPATLVLTYTDRELLELDYDENFLKIGEGAGSVEWTILTKSVVDNNAKTVTLKITEFPSGKDVGILPIALPPSATNQNTNVVSNGNENQNANMNVNTNTNVSLPLPSTADQDQDGLTDVEEELYGVLATNPDSDGDGYVDGKELTALYSPKHQNLKLQDSGLVETYTHLQTPFTVFFPEKWFASPSADGTKVFFTSATGEFMEILVEDNTAQLDPKTWFLNTSPGVDSTDIVEVTVKGLAGVRSPDQRSTYLASGEKMFVITYNSGIRDDLNFMTTYFMMVASFAIPQNAPAS
ncbi:MAG: hypothetical protein AAB733_02925 [Patescibacteria group bacterium]